MPPTQIPDLDVFVRWSEIRGKWAVVFSGKIKGERLECVPREFGHVPNDIEIQSCKADAVVAFSKVVNL